jgi:hypothetical protein
MKKKWIIGGVIIVALFAGALFALYYPWIKIAEGTTRTCKRCGSNKNETILFGKLGRVETNRYDTVTYRAPDFDLCQHQWVYGTSPTNQINRGE